jgi:uncharacterized membrane protein
MSKDYDNYVGDRDAEDLLRLLGDGVGGPGGRIFELVTGALAYRTAKLLADEIHHLAEELHSAAAATEKNNHRLLYLTGALVFATLMISLVSLVNHPF